MKTIRPAAALLALALTVTPLLFSQESAEVASLRAKAERGNGIAQYNLGLAYAEGRGIGRDPVEAYVWLSLARDNGARGRALDTLLATLDRETVAAAQARLADRRTALGIRAPAPASARPASGPSTPAGETGPAPQDAPTPPPGAAPASPAAPNAGPAAGPEDAARASELATLRAERDRLLRFAAEQESNARAATEAGHNLQNQLSAAQARIAELERQPAGPGYPDYTERVKELTAEVTTLRTLRDEQQRALAAAERRAAGAGRVQELEAQIARLQSDLATARNVPPPAPDTAALDQRTRELQTALQELQAARAFGEQVEATLNRVNDQKTAMETALRAAEQARDANAREFVTAREQIAALEAQLTAARQAPAPAADTTALDQRTRELRTALTELQAARAFGEQVEATLNRVNDQKAALEASLRGAEQARDANAREFEQARARIAELEPLAARASQPAAPAFPDLRGRVAELESALTAARNARPAYPDLSGRVAALEQQLAQAGADLTAARNAAPAYPDLSSRVQELETQLARTGADLAAARSAAPAFPDLRDRVQELETSLATANRNARAALTLHEEVAAARATLEADNTRLQGRVRQLESAQPAYPDLRNRVAQLEQQLAARPEIPDLRGRVGELEQQLAAARTAAPAYPDLSARVAELEGALQSARTEQERLREFIASQEQKMVHLAEQADSETKRRMAEAVATANQAREQLATRTAELEAMKAELTRAQEAVVAARNAAPAYPDLRDRVAQLEQQLATRPSHPDLSGRVAELETALAAARDAQPAYPDLSSRVASLEQQLAQAGADLTAARNAAPAYPDLRNRVAELEQQLAAKPAYPDLSGRVAELEQQLAAKPAAPAYPDYTNLVKDLTAEVAQLRGVRDEQQQALAAAGQRVAALETDVAARTAEVARAREALAAGQPAGADRTAELEAALAETTRKLVATEEAVATTRQQLTAAQAAAGSRGENEARLGRERDELSGRVTVLGNEVAQLRAERERMQKLLADTGRQLREASGQVSRLKNVENYAAELRDTVLAQTKAADEAKARIASLEASLAAQAPAPAYPDLSGRVAELEQQLATATNDATAAQAVKAGLEVALAQAQQAARRTAPAYPDLSGRVAELERQLDATNAARSELESRLAAASAQPAAPAYPDLRERVAELEGQVSRAASDLAAARAATPAYPDLSGRVAELERDLAVQRQAELDRVAAGTPAPTYPDLSGRVQDLQQQLEAALASRADLEARLAAAAAQSSAPAYPDLSGRVAELEQALAAARSSAPAYPDLRDRVTALEQSLADATNEVTAANAVKAGLEVALADARRSTRAAAPAYPDLSGRVAELERELAAQRNRGPAYPNLSGRVVELEGELADVRRRLTETQDALRTAAETPVTPPAAATVASTDADAAELQRRLAETEDRLATALRGYALLERDRDDAQARVAAANEALTTEKNGLAAQVSALTAELEQLRPSAATAAQASGERDSLATQVQTLTAEVERLRAEATENGEALAALRRVSSQGAGEVASTRALVEQLRGANAVLAQENYQLKTQLSRTAGTPAPVATTAVRTAPTAPTGTLAPVTSGRVHVVAAGDSLSRISQRYYGAASRWPEIYNANADKLGPNGILRIGTELRIP